MKDMKNSWSESTGNMKIFVKLMTLMAYQVRKWFMFNIGFDEINSGILSQELRNDPKMRLLQIFKSWELFVEILGQVQNFLRNIENLVFASFAYID